MQAMTIGRLARCAALAPETLRHYERLGLLQPSSRSEANYRLYDASAVERLNFIRRALALGFSLPDIAELLALHGDADMAAAKAVAQRRIAQIDARVADLLKLKAGLQTLADSCPGHGPAAACPILKALAAGPDTAASARSAPQRDAQEAR
ncbi:HTH-type transcriptional regulator ZntR [mine drainage metagenome]|uniref:HTH-type transcriptional regulator ZntR n=1 Tax=mine drainage metagenome TaxID=410659 RepID=A0A1J5QXK5_9ZZZZ